MKLAPIALLSLTTLFSSNLMAAEDIPIYLWSNEEGFTKKEHCILKEKKDSDFRISTFSGRTFKHTENLRNYNGVRQSHLPNGSLLLKTYKKSKRNYSSIKVLGINHSNPAKFNRWFSKRGDEGYLYNRSLLPIEDFVLSIKSPNNILENEKELFLRAEAGDHYYNLDCEKSSGEYQLFRAYKRGAETSPTALIGIDSKSTQTLSSFSSYKIEAAMKIIPALNLHRPITDFYNENENEIENDVIADIQEEVDTFMAIASTDVDMVINNVGDIFDSGEGNSDDKPADGNFKLVACVQNNTLNVRNESLDKVLFKAKKGAAIKRFQGWGNNDQTKVIDGVTYSFTKVQFPEREDSENNIGWVATAFVKQESKCPYLKPSGSILRMTDNSISGLNDEKCCEFPTVNKPTHAYTSGMRKFGANRGGGTRKHAACDLYRYKYEPILSVAPGTVVRDRYKFYQGTYAVEVVHSGGFVVRYGELDKKQESGIKKGKKLKMGERLGYMGKVNSNCCRPMLHFELYKGNISGPLSQGGTKYRRRSDLLNPTLHLLKWEAKRF